MTDFNFFEPYLSTNKTNNSVKLVAITGGVVAALFIASTLAFNNYQIITTKNDIKSINSKISDAEFQRKLKKSEELAKKISILQKYDGALTTINSNVKDRAIVTPNFMNKILATIPEGVFFDSITVDGKTVQIVAKSKTRNAIGELQHNLKDVDFINDVFIDGIASDLSGSPTEQFSFTIKCGLKEDLKNENN